MRLAASGRECDGPRMGEDWLGALVHRPNHDLSSSRIQSPSHSRRVPPNLGIISAHVGYHVVQGFASLRKQIADANGESPGQRGYWTVVREKPHTYPPHPGHPLAPEGQTRSRKDTLAHATDTLAHPTDTLAQRHARA